MLTINSARGKNKATELKKLIQQVCHTQRSNREDPRQTSRDVNKQTKNTSKEPKFTKIKSTSIQASKLIKSVTLKNGLNSTNTSRVNIKNKENISQSQNIKQKKIIPSLFRKQEPSKINQQSKSKHLKLIHSVENNHLPKSMSSTTINREKKTIKFTEPDERLRTKKISEIKLHLEKPKKTKISLQDFDLGKKLGKGRFGNVYLAQHKQLKFSCAMKIVNIAQLKQSEMQYQLIQEIKLQMYMNHPNVLKMYGYFSDEKNIYLLLQLGNECLFRQLRNKKYFTEQETAYYIKQIIESLKYLHNQSIIHRDIKPENILISNGVLKLSDFGWSTYSPIHKRQTFCGTLDYVPPEIVQGDFYDEKVDIWSLGVLCYELSTGKAPFEVPNDQQGTYDKILSVELTFPSHLSNQLRDLISRILIKQPKQRLNLSEIQNHPWFCRYNTVGRYISKEIWETWDHLK